MADLDGKNVVLGVSGGIAAYKAPDVVRRLRERGAQVQVVMTRGAARFITALSLQAVSGRPVRDDLWDEAAEAAMGHIEIARWADLVLVAPASADFIARLAAGLADDLLTTLCLATEAPIVLAPAMNRAMWSNAATRDNVRLLDARSVSLIGPAEGDQACGETGPGRMTEPETIAEEICRQLAGDGVIDGRRVVVTAGPTREVIDPVRYLTNRSSGKMGFAVARAARSAGAEVTLVAGPVSLATPPGVERVNVESADEMLAAAEAAARGADVFIAAAAVADYRPVEPSDRKIKKTAETLRLELTRNPDVLATIAAWADRPFMVGFAAETDNVEANAETKLEAKKLDMIAANRVGPGVGFDCDQNTLTVIWPGGRETLPAAEKDVLARQLVELIAERLGGKGS
jgi:phosphopantothenoylcysteine decarboxylase/phosphopantothenate--cysteine ligase